MILCAAVDVGIYIFFLKFGLDRHAWDVNETMAVSARQTMLAVETVNLACTSLTKISILYFCKRLSGGTYRTSKFNFVIHASICFVVASLASFLVTLFLTCYPLKAFWLRFSPAWETQHDYACLDEFAHLVSATSVSVAEDLIAFGVPAALLCTLQIGRKKKIALTCLLGLGFLPCIAGILRTVYTIRVYDDFDSTWNVYPAYICLVVETHLGILCASAPALNSSATNLVRHVRANSNWKNKSKNRAGASKDLQAHALDLENQDLRHSAPTPPPKDIKPGTGFAGAVVMPDLAAEPPILEYETEMERAYICERRVPLAHILLFNRSQPSISGFSAAASDMPTIMEHEETRPFISSRTREIIGDGRDLTALPTLTNAWWRAR
ncbi:hypothetical protein MPH_07547 [Macrophomina phaseolina MS6]|uniref:Rhodopsin domain-containing protein n=1 Tax=Macrophomina phaseolina (strain MS6) TaxID=1126212 RepID=K2RKK7_MACPH|nr:hypothetical protein MPH_07547 [Macrophomina phaseolina MS6]